MATPFAVGDQIAVVTAFQTNNKGQHKISLYPGDTGLAEEFSPSTGSALISFDKDTSLMHWIKVADFPKLKKLTTAHQPSVTATRPKPGFAPGQQAVPLQPPQPQYAAPPRTSVNESFCRMPRSSSVVLQPTPQSPMATPLTTSQSQAALPMYQAGSSSQRHPSGVVPTSTGSGVFPVPGGSGVFQQPQDAPPKIGVWPRLSLAGSASVPPGSGVVRQSSFGPSKSLPQLAIPQPTMRKVVYLPKVLPDGETKCLEQESPNKFRVLGMPSGEGLAFRNSKNIADSSVHFAWKDNYINGIDEEDGWVKCELEVRAGPPIVRHSFAGSASAVPSPVHRLSLPVGACVSQGDITAMASPMNRQLPCAPAPAACALPCMSPSAAPTPTHCPGLGSRSNSVFNIHAAPEQPSTCPAGRQSPAGSVVLQPAPSPAPEVQSALPLPLAAKLDNAPPVDRAEIAPPVAVPQAQTGPPQGPWNSALPSQCKGSDSAVWEDSAGLLSMMSAKDADEEMFVRAARESNLANHGMDDFDTHMHVTDAAYNLYMRKATLADEKIFGGLNRGTTNLQWAVDTYFPGESSDIRGLQLAQVLLFWDHIMTFGTHSFLIVTRTHVAHRADYINASHRWIVRLDEVEGLQDLDPAIDRDGRRRLRLLDRPGRTPYVTICAAMGTELHALVANLAKLVRSRP